MATNTESLPTTRTSKRIGSRGTRLALLLAVVGFGAAEHFRSLAGSTRGAIKEVIADARFDHDEPSVDEPDRSLSDAPRPRLPHCTGDAISVSEELSPTAVMTSPAKPVHQEQAPFTNHFSVPGGRRIHFCSHPVSDEIEIPGLDVENISQNDKLPRSVAFRVIEAIKGDIRCEGRITDRFMFIILDYMDAQGFEILKQDYSISGKNVSVNISCKSPDGRTVISAFAFGPQGVQKPPIRDVDLQTPARFAQDTFSAGVSHREEYIVAVSGITSHTVGSIKQVSSDAEAGKLPGKRRERPGPRP